MVHGATIPSHPIPADSEPRHTVIFCFFKETALALALKKKKKKGEPIQAQSHRETPSLREDFASISPLFCPHRVFLVFHFLGFVCRSMPMLEKLSMPLAVRLAGITNCHVFCSCIKNY